MRGFETASVHYCSHLGKNVIFENFYSVSGEVCDCKGKEQCGFSEFGCRNRIYSPRLVAREEAG